MAFCPGVLAGPGVLVWRSGALAFSFWRSRWQISGLGWRSGVLAFWRSPSLGVLLWRSAWRSGGWRSAGVLALCLAFWRSAWRSRSLLDKSEGKG